MSGISKVKILAVAVIAVFAVSALSIAFMAPSEPGTGNDGVLPEKLTVSDDPEEEIQSGSMQYLMGLLELCYIYVDTADIGEYDYIYGEGCQNGKTYTVTEGNVTHNILLNDGAEVDFTTCHTLVMDGASICINGENIRFINGSEDKEFSIVVQNGGKMMIGSNIRLAVSSTVTATPFTINYKANNNLFDENHSPLSTLTVDGTFSINLDDNVPNSRFVLNRDDEEGSITDWSLKTTDVHYEVCGRAGKEMEVIVDYDFTDYYNFVVSEFPSGTESNPPKELSVSDWIMYFFDDQYAIPEGNASFYLNGLEMDYIHEEYVITGYTYGSYPIVEKITDEFDVTNIDDLIIGIDSYNKSGASNKHGKIYASADVFEYTHEYDEILTDTYSNTGSTITDSTDDVSIEDLTFDLTVGGNTGNTDVTELSIELDTLDVNIDYSGEEYSRVVRVLISDLDTDIQMNRAYIDDLYDFIVQALFAENMMEQLAEADYTVILCEAVIDLQCEDLSSTYNYVEYDLDSSGTREYMPYQSNGTITVKDIDFNTNYRTANKIDVSVDRVIVDHNETYTSMQKVGIDNKYYPTKRTVNTDVDVREMSYDSNVKLTDINSAIHYVVKTIAGQDVSGTELKGISTNTTVNELTYYSVDELRYARLYGRDYQIWEKMFNVDVIFGSTISKVASDVDISNYDMNKVIDYSGNETGYVQFDYVTADTESNYPEDDVNTNLTVEAGMHDVYCGINSETAKMTGIMGSIITMLSSGNISDGLSELVSKYLLDGTDTEITLSFDKMFLEYESATTNTKNSTVEASEDISFIFGKDVPTYDDEKAMSIVADLNAGNNASRIGYHDSYVSLSMGSDSQIHDYEGSYDLINGTQYTDFTVTGVNATVTLDTIVTIQGTIASESAETMTGDAGSSVTSVVTNSDSSVEARFSYDKIESLYDFIDKHMNTEGFIPEDLTTEFAELLDGLYLHTINGSQTYSLETRISGVGGLYINGDQDYVTEDFEVYIDYLNNHYISVAFGHISMAMSEVSYDGSYTDTMTTDMELYDAYLKVDTELGGLNDFLQYAYSFLTTGAINNMSSDNFDMVIDLDLVGRSDDNEYIMEHRINEKKGSTVVSMERRTFDFTSLSLDITVGTSGVEQLAMIASDLSVTDSNTAGNDAVTTTFTISYIELSIGTNSKSLYKLVSALYSQFGKPSVQTSGTQLYTALLSFISDSSNTKIYFRMSSCEFCTTSTSDTTDSVYKISVPASKTEKFAVTVSDSLKLSCDDQFLLTTPGTYLKISVADDSKIIYSDSYGGNEFIEYYEFENPEVSIKLDTSVALLDVATKYAGDNESMIREILSKVNVTLLITSDSGKYTSSRIHDDNTSYKIQVRSDDSLLLRGNSSIINLYSSTSLSESLCLECGESTIVSEYMSPETGTIKNVYNFDSCKAYYLSGEFVIESSSVDAEVNIDGTVYGMKTDGTVYFDSTLPSLMGYSIYVNGSKIEKECYGIAPTIHVETFTVSNNSVLYPGKTFIKGTQLELKVEKDAAANFAGWKVNNVMVPNSLDGSAVYYAPQDDVVTISYVYGYILTYDSTGGSEVDQVVLNLGDTIDLSIVPVKEGCTFDRWNTTYTVMPAFNLTVTAVWSPNKYMLTFDYDNGTESKEQAMLYEDTITLPYTPTREGYTFSGWLGYTENMIMPSHDLTIKALWSKVITEKAIGVNSKGTLVDIDADIAEMGSDVIDAMISLSNKTNSKVNMNFSGASLSMNTDSLKKLSCDEITGRMADLKLSLTKSNVVSDEILRTVDESDRNILNNVRYAISIEAHSNGTTSDLGKIVVTVPVDDMYEGATFVVVYVSSEGEVSLIDAVCEKVDGQTCVVFETDHFSYFALSQTGDSSSGSDGSSMSMIVYIAIGVASILVIGIIVFVILKRRYII